MRIPGSSGVDLAELDAWPFLAKAVACAVVGVATAAIGYGFGLADARATLAAAKAETARRTAELRRRGAASKRDVAAGAERDAAAAALAALRAQLPGATEVPGLLAAVSRAATETGLLVEQVELGDERPLWLDSTSAYEATGQLGSYVEVPLRIRVVGGYHQLGAFAAAVAALPPLVVLRDFELRPAEGDPARLALTVAAATFRHAPAPGKAAP